MFRFQKNLIIGCAFYGFVRKSARAPLDNGDANRPEILAAVTRRLSRPSAEKYTKEEAKGATIRRADCPNVEHLVSLMAGRTGRGEEPSLKAIVALRMLETGNVSVHVQAHPNRRRGGRRDFATGSVFCDRDVPKACTIGETRRHLRCRLPVATIIRLEYSFSITFYRCRCFCA